MVPARALRTRIDRMRAEGGGEHVQDLSLAELMRLTVAAARAFAPVAQAERAALGLTGSQYLALISPEIERKTTAEIKEYLTGRARAGP